MTPIYWRLLGALIIAVVIGGIGYRVGANHWEAKYRAELAHQWQQKAKGEETARKALEKQLADANATATNNRQVMHELQQDTVAILAKRDIAINFYRGLLANASRSRADSLGLPKAADRPPAAGASREGSGEKIAGLLADVDAECARNANRLDALSAEIRPQLEDSP